MNSRNSKLVLALCTLAMSAVACGPKPNSPVTKTAQQAPSSLTTPSSLETADADAAQQKTALALPNDFGHFTGDWDEIVKRGMLRVLVVYSKGGFYYDKGQPRGVNVEAMDEFELFVRKDRSLSAANLKIAFVPTPPGRLLQALNDGIGDVICASVIISPEREKLVDFTIPVMSDVKLIVVTSKMSSSINSVEEMSSKDIYVGPTSLAKPELEALNQRFRNAGKPEINIKVVDPNLTEDDALEMVNAGLLPAIVAANFRAALWSRAYPNLVISPVAVKEQGDIGWAIRKGSPQLKAVLDNFVKGHRVGTTFGNVLVQRYMKQPEVLRNAASEAEMKKFKALVKYFQQYAAEFNFDYLMLAAQAYQESKLQQNLVSRRGAVGVMQVLPQYASANPINIRDVRDVQSNIHAGTKMLANITNTYFNDPGISQVDKTLFTFAAYNAGPNRILRIRNEAQRQGLNPNLWFGNVELIAAKDIGQETVQYVSNIFKYYVAYKMALEQIQTSQRAKEQFGQSSRP